MIAATLGVAPMLAPILILVLALVTAIEEWKNGGSPIATTRAALRTPVGLACIVFLLFAALSSAWAEEPYFGLSSVLRPSITFIAAAYLVAALRQQMSGMDAVRRNRFVRAVPIGVMIAVAFLLIELLTRNGLSRLVFEIAPVLWAGSPKLASSSTGEGARLVPLAYIHNRGVAAMVIIAPAFLLGLAIWLKSGVKSWPIVLSAAMLAAMVLLSDSETAKLALIGGALFYALASMRPAGAWRSLSAVCIVGTLLALPLGMLPHALGVHTWSAAGFGAQERALIWRNTAVSTFARPIAGVGVQSTRFQDSDLPKIESPSGMLRNPLGWHAHNAFLQTWFELGAIGAAGLLAVLLGVVSASRRLGERSHSAAIAFVAIVVCTAATGWGLWQPWLIATFGIGAVLLAMLDAAREADREAAGDRYPSHEEARA